MATKNIYIADADLPIYDKAVALAGDKLSSIITNLVRQYVENEEAKTGGMESINIEVGDKSNYKKVQFVGKVIASENTYHGQTSEGRDRGTEWKIYATKKGKFLVWWEHWSCWQNEGSNSEYVVMDSLPGYDQDIGKGLDVVIVPGQVIAEAAKAIGVTPAQVLDI